MAEEEFDIEIPDEAAEQITRFNKLWTISVTKLPHPPRRWVVGKRAVASKLKALAFAPTPKILKFNTFYVLPYG